MGSLAVQWHSGAFETLVGHMGELISSWFKFLMATPFDLGFHFSITFL